MNPLPQRGVNWEGFWRYRWAADLFDYLAPWSPADDFQPNYPMQREWIPGEQYQPGDLVSIYNATAGVYGHEIWQCTATYIPPQKLSELRSGAGMISATH